MRRRDLITLIGGVAARRARAAAADADSWVSQQRVARRPCAVSASIRIGGWVANPIFRLWSPPSARLFTIGSLAARGT